MAYSSEVIPSRATTTSAATTTLSLARLSITIAKLCNSHEDYEPRVATSSCVNVS